MHQIISYRAIGRLAFPVVVAQAVVLVTGLIDLAFVGPFGTEAIAAVSIANVLCATLLNFLDGLRLATTVLVAKASAAGNRVKAAAVVNSGLFLAALVGLILAAFAPNISDAVYTLAGGEPLRHYGADYLTVWLSTIPLILFSYVLVGLFRGLNNTATPLYSSVVTCLLNVVFDYMFVNGGFGFPSVGVKGAAWGTGLATLAGLMLTGYLAFKNPLTSQCINFKQPFRGHIAEYLSLAVAVGMNTGFTLLALLLFVWLIKPLGAVALAVHQITLQVFNFAYLPAVGFLITASILVPQLLAREENALLRPTVLRICKTSFGVILVTSSLLFVFSGSVSRFFSPADPLVAKQARETLRLVCLGQLFTSIYMVMRGALTGCQDTRFIVYEGLASGYLIFLPLAYWLAIHSGYGILGGYLAFVLWCVTDCLVLTVRFLRQNRR